MITQELIAWHKHQIAFLPDTENPMVKHHQDAICCIERLLAEHDAAVKALDLLQQTWAENKPAAQYRAERDALRMYYEAKTHDEKCVAIARIETIDAARKP